MAKKKKTPSPGCSACDHEAAKKICMREDGLSSKGCPTLVYEEVLAAADKEYDQTEVLEFARQEADCYANLTRAVNIFDLCFHLAPTVLLAIKYARERQTKQAYGKPD